MLAVLLRYCPGCFGSIYNSSVNGIEEMNCIVLTAMSNGFTRYKNETGKALPRKCGEGAASYIRHDLTLVGGLQLLDVTPKSANVV